MTTVRRGVDDGVTVIELVVATTVTALLLSLMAGMFMQIMKATGDGQSTRKATGVAATVMDEIAGVVRQGVQVQTAATGSEGAVVGDVASLCGSASGSTPTCLIIDTYANVTIAPGQPSVAPVRVVFSVNGSGNLVEKRYAATFSGGYYGFSNTTTPSSRVVNGPIDTSGTDEDALFVYWDVNGDRVVPGPSGLTAADASTVTAVSVNVSVANPSSRGADPVVLSNRITMPNIAIANGGS